MNEQQHNSSSSPIKPEARPPLLKKSRTISASAAAVPLAVDDTPPTLFPGPLFPAVRRIATTPPPISLPSGVVAASSSFSDQRFGVSDRDYVYPSFLGPYSSKTRASAKSSSSTSKSQKREVPAINFPARSASMPSNLDRVTEFRPPPGLAVMESKQKSKLKQERDLKTVPAQILANSLTPSTPSSESPGLAQIWEDILGFENAEFYIKRWQQLDDLRFGQVLVSFPDAIPCGIKVAADGGKIVLNPDDNYVLKEGDEVIVIAEDDDTYSPGPIQEDSSIRFDKAANLCASTSDFASTDLENI